DALQLSIGNIAPMKIRQQSIVEPEHNANQDQSSGNEHQVSPTRKSALVIEVRGLLLCEFVLEIPDLTADTVHGDFGVIFLHRVHRGRKAASFLNFEDVISPCK